MLLNSKKCLTILLTVLYRLNRAKALEEEKKKKIKQGQGQKKLPLGKKQKTSEDPPVIAAAVSERDKGKRKKCSG